jgi:hypothetical protein
MTIPTVDLKGKTWYTMRADDGVHGCGRCHNGRATRHTWLVMWLNTEGGDSATAMLMVCDDCHAKITGDTKC